MPYSVPGITFDEEGVCSLCRSYIPHTPLGEESLRQLLSSHGPGAKGYDSIVPLSGGRDSTYVLYLAKSELGLNPLAVNFDGEFRDSQAVVNMENACRALGVDLLVVRSRHDVAAKIVKANIKTAINLGLPSLIMAMCRQCSYGYTSVAYREAERNEAPFILWGTSSAESTERLQATMWENRLPSGWRRIRSINFYRTEYYCLRQRLEFSVSGNPRLSRRDPRLRNPRIHEIKVFDYLPWDRRRIKDTIIGELGWVKPPSRISTWRTDCLLHELVNFLFVKSVGCTKDCLGYCNMVNAGQMSRDEALQQEEAALSAIRWERMAFLLEHYVGLSPRDIERINVMQSQSPYPER